jgi:hypothetical protein
VSDDGYKQLRRLWLDVAAEISMRQGRLSHGAPTVCYVVAGRRPHGIRVTIGGCHALKKSRGGGWGGEQDVSWFGAIFWNSRYMTQDDWKGLRHLYRK